MKTLEEINKTVEKIRSGMRLLDDIVYHDHKTNRFSITNTQAEVVKSVLKLLDDISFVIPFQNYKQIEYDNSELLDQKECGTPVGIEYDGAEYDGIYLGELALSISSGMKNDVLTVSYALYNPAIYVPALRKVVYGCQCWWYRKKETDYD